MDYVNFLGHKIMPSQRDLAAVAYPADKDREKDFLRVTGQMMPVTITTVASEDGWFLFL